MTHFRKLIIASTLVMTTATAFAKAKNVILFIGDGVGVSSLNAASIYGYGKARALYLQQMPRLALSDTSTTHEWVTDAAASVTALATGVKTRNGVLSMSSTAERGIKDGANLKSIMEYAEERGLATGIIGNEDRTGVGDAPLSAFYAHLNNRGLVGNAFLQLLNPKFGNGVDVVIGSGRKLIEQQIKQAGNDWTAEAKSKGYALADSFAALEAMQGSENRVIGLWDDADFSLPRAVNEAIRRLSQNPNGFLLVVHTDCHLPSARRNLARIVELDNAVKAAAQATKPYETLLLMTADHSFDLRIKGEQLTETQKSSAKERIAIAVSMEDQHTAEEVPVIAAGPGSERIQGYLANTDVFHIMMDAFAFDHYQVQRKYPIEGTEGFDYVTLDADKRRLYVSHGTHVDVLNADSGAKTGEIPETPGVHGIAIASSLKHGFTTNGGEDKVSVFDPETLKVSSKIPVGKGPDGIFFDAPTGRIFTNNHGSHDMTVIDAATAKVIGTVSLNGDGEQIVAGREGLYVNLEDKHEVVNFDPKTLEIKHRFPVAPGATPTGLAIDKQSNRLFIACRNNLLVVMDAESGKVITSMPIGAQADAAEFDAERHFVFVSNGDGTLNIFGEKADDKYTNEGVVYTQPSAKTMAYDAKTKRVYLPAADIETIPATAPGGRATRKIWPGSFGLVVVGMQAVRKPLWVSPDQFDAISVVPKPPAVNSPQHQAELAEVHHMQDTRTIAQIEHAKADDAEESMFVFKEVLGDKFVRAELPYTSIFSDHVRADEGLNANILKNYYQRSRPYHFDATVKPVCKTTDNRADFGYPSGHATTGYLEGMVLAMMIPEKSDAIMARADDYAHSRVVCGVHYPGDGKASKALATAMVNIMKNNPQFQQELAQATAETRKALGF